MFLVKVKTKASVVGTRKLRIPRFSKLTSSITPRPILPVFFLLYKDFDGPKRVLNKSN